MPGRWKQEAEPADKPGSVVDSHSSRRHVTVTLKQPTRIQRGPRHRIPIWSCSRWGLPYRSVARLAVRSYRTISPLPRLLPQPCGCADTLGRTFVRHVPTTTGAFGGIFLLHFPSACAAQALPGTLPCGARTFLGTLRKDDATVWPTPPTRIVARHLHPCLSVDSIRHRRQSGQGLGNHHRLVLLRPFG